MSAYLGRQARALLIEAARELVRRTRQPGDEWSAGYEDGIRDLIQEVTGWDHEAVERVLQVEVN